MDWDKEEEEDNEEKDKEPVLSPVE